VSYNGIADVKVRVVAPPARAARMRKERVDSSKYPFPDRDRRRETLPFIRKSF